MLTNSRTDVQSPAVEGGAALPSKDYQAIGFYVPHGRADAVREWLRAKGFVRGIVDEQ